MGSALPRGVFLLSLDLELAWGGVHGGSWRRRAPLYARTREVVHRLLALLARYEVRATWAVVGHLLLERCAPVDGVKHPEVVRPTYAWRRADWFADDPCGDASTEPCWYAPDLVRAIRACPVPQEVGSHGFSHLIVGDPGCGETAFASELLAAQDAAARLGLALRSFVYPRNALGHVETLAAHGFACYRGVTPRWYGRLPRPLRRVGRAVDHLLPVAPPVAQPRRVGGVWEFPDSQLYLHRQGWGRLVPVGLRVRKAVWGLRRAARERALFHLWCHPFNLASDPEGLLGGLEAVFREAARLRARGLLESRAMGELAAGLDREAVQGGAAA